MTAYEMEERNRLGGDFGSEYMLSYFCRYVDDWTLTDDPEQAEDMLCCIHDGYEYRKGLIQGWNTEEEFNFFDLYNLLEDDFTEVTTTDGKVLYKIRYFKKEFMDTFLSEDWYFESLREAEENYDDYEF